MHLRSTLVTAGVAAAVTLAGTAAHAQSLGTFRWQQQPYCNVITVNVVQSGAVYQLDGTDNQCGGVTLASVSGLAFPNPNATIGFGLTVVTSPGGIPVHVDATISLATLSGTWRDSSGQTGPWTFISGAGLGGSPRPAPVPAFSGGITVGGSTITNVGAPVNATDGANKAYVDSVASRGFFTQSAGTVGLPAGAGTTNVLTLNLPAGTYAVFARGQFNNNDAAASLGTLQCDLTVGSATAEIEDNFFAGPNLQAAETESGAGFVLATLAAPAQALFFCTRTAGWVSGNVVDPQLLAISLQP